MSIDSKQGDLMVTMDLPKSVKRMLAKARREGAREGYRTALGDVASCAFISGAAHRASLPVKARALEEAAAALSDITEGPERTGTARWSDGQREVYSLAIEEAQGALRERAAKTRSEADSVEADVDRDRLIQAAAAGAYVRGRRDALASMHISDVPVDVLRGIASNVLHNQSGIVAQAIDSGRLDAAEPVEFRIESFPTLVHFTSDNYLAKESDT